MSAFGARARARAWKRAAEAWHAYADGRGTWLEATAADAQARALELMERRHGGRAVVRPLELARAEAVTRQRGRAFIARWLADDDPKGTKIGPLGKKKRRVSRIETQAYAYGRASSGDKSALESSERVELEDGTSFALPSPRGVRCGACGSSRPITPGCRNCEAWAAAVNRAART